MKLNWNAKIVLIALLVVSGFLMWRFGNWNEVEAEGLKKRVSCPFKIVAFEVVRDTLESGEVYKDHYSAISDTIWVSGLEAIKNPWQGVFVKQWKPKIEGAHLLSVDKWWRCGKCVKESVK